MDWSQEIGTWRLELGSQAGRGGPYAPAGTGVLKTFHGDDEQLTDTSRNACLL